MEKICVVFDCFKDAFHINRDNKKLYRPQMVLIIVKLFMIIAMGLRVYSWIGDTSFEVMGPEQALWFISRYGLIFLLLMLVYGIVSVAVESGLYNMYKNCLVNGSTSNEDFFEGVKKYFGSFLLGYVLLVLFWIVISPLFLILGLITLTIGFTLIPLALSIFLTMWKVSMVMNDISLFGSVKDSFIFVKRNLISVTTLQLIHWSFVKGTSGISGNFGNIVNSRNNVNDFPMNRGTMFNDSLPKFDLVKIIKIVIGILIPVITVASLVSFLVKMVFEVFFSLSLFTAYRRLNYIDGNNIREGNLLCGLMK